MAITADAIWEVRSSATASNVNGGFFKPGATGTDYSQQDAAQYNLTGCTSAAANAIILNANAAANMVGNGCRVVSGTNAIVGWYEIISVVAGVSITVDRNWGSGAVANGVVNVGGALSLGSSDDAVFEAMTAGNTMYVKSGTYTLGGTVSIANAGTTKDFKVIGYQTTRGDTPTTANRPTFDCGAAIFTTGASWKWRNLNFVGTAATVVTHGNNNVAQNCRIINKSTTAARNAFQAGNVSYLQNCELVSYRGYALNTNGAIVLDSCWLHSSDSGLRVNALASVVATDTIIESCVSNAVLFSTAITVGSNFAFKNCTLFGSLNTTGTGVNINTGSIPVRFINCIISGFATGISHADAAQTVGFESVCAYYNNDTDVSNWTKDSASVTSNPAFNNVGQVTVTTASTSNSGNTLTKTGATFQTAGVTPGRDYVHITSTGGTAGIYGIVSVDSETQLTLDLAPGTSTGNVSAQITTGKDFRVGPNMKALGNAAVGAGATLNFVDLGAAQRVGGLSTDPGIANVKTGTNYTINDSALTGTLAASASLGGFSSAG